MSILTDKDNRGTEIFLYDSRNKLITSIVLGLVRTEEMKSGSKIQLGRYIFLPQYNKIYFTDTLFSESSFSSNGWLNKIFPKIKNIKSIESFKNRKQLWKIERTVDEKSYMIVKNGKPTEEQLNTDRIVSALNNLNFQSVDNPEFRVDFDRDIKITTFDNKMYIIRIGPLKNRMYPVKIKYYPLISNIRDVSKRYNKWIYLIDSKRIAPLLVDKDDLTKKMFKPKDRKFAMPIG